VSARKKKLCAIEMVAGDYGPWRVEACPEVRFPVRVDMREGYPDHVCGYTPSAARTLAGKLLKAADAVERARKSKRAARKLRRAA
jgi:hypothetical protein